MNFRWLQFWGDLRQGLHPSWRDALPVFGDPSSELGHHHHESAAAIRSWLAVPWKWDEGFSPEQIKWILLNNKDFDDWCEAVGLLTLAEHLKRVISVRTIERLRVSLDKRSLAKIIQHIQEHKIAGNSPLPLDLPSAYLMGGLAMCRACQEYPNLWSRLRLRLDRTISDSDISVSTNLVYAPDIKQLLDLDRALFEPVRKAATRAAAPEEKETWIQTRTLSA